MKARLFEERGLPNRPVGAGSAGIFLFRGNRAAARRAITGKIAVRLSDAELAERHRGRMPKKADSSSEALWKGAETIGSAEGGALTHPGRAGETCCYADI